MIRRSLIAGAVLAAVGSNCLAAPYLSMDPRSLGMGGTGVSMTNSGLAPLHNPALLATAPPDEDFNFEAALGFRAADPDQLIDSAKNFSKEDYVAAFDAALAPFTGATPPTTPAEFTTAQNALSTATSNLRFGLTDISNKPMETQTSTSVLATIPSKKYGVGFVASIWAAGGFVGEATDGDLNDLEAYVQTITGITDPTNVTEVANAVNTIATNPLDVNTMTSSLTLQGALFEEYGLSFSREFQMFGQPIAMGITPKYVMATTYEAIYLVKDLDNNDTSLEQGEKKSTGFTADFGMARDFHNGWKTGFVVKNLVPQGYKTINGNTIDVDPAARVGFSRHWSRGTIAADLDLTENSPVGMGDKTQYIALGGELDLWLVELRAGYRYNVPNDQASVASVGLGLYVFGATVDAGAAASPDGNELNAAVQVGFKF